MTAILASIGSISCSYLDTTDSNHVFFPGSRCGYLLGNCIANIMPADSTSRWRETHNTQPRRLSHDHASSTTSASTTSNIISTSWLENISHLHPELATSVPFSFDLTMLPDSNLIDLDVSLDGLMPRVAEPGSALSPPMASENLIGGEHQVNRYQSQSPSLLYASQSRQHTHSPNPTSSFQSTDTKQYNTAISESACSDTPSSQDSGDNQLTEKRRRNKLAAQRLRQKKLDRVSGLETRLEEVIKERDELRLRLAKWEGEATAMRQLFEQKKK